MQTRTFQGIPVSADLAELEGAINREMSGFQPMIDMFLWDARSKVQRVQSHMKFENEVDIQVLKNLETAQALLKGIEGTMGARCELSEAMGRIKALMEMR